MNVLVYTRPRIKVFFHELVKKISCFHHVTFMSDHKGEEEICIMSYYYEAKEDMRLKHTTPKNRLNFERIVQRCRFLRSLPFEKAILTAKAMCIAVERIVEQYQPDFIFGMVMDSYVLDIMDQVMRARNSQYIGFLNNMVNGYSRLTSRGELIQLNNPTDEIIDKTLSLLSASQYLPNMQRDFMWRTSPYLCFFTKYLKEQIKILYYFFKKLKDKDADNFYYNTVAAKHCMSCRHIDQLFFRRFENKNWLHEIEDAKKNNKLIVYLPLQFYPECSVDYWGTELELGNFYAVIDQVIANQYQI